MHVGDKGEKKKDDEVEKAGIHVDASWGKRCSKEMGEGQV